MLHPPCSFSYVCVNFIFSLRVGAVLDHFGYPTPSLTEWQQHMWYDLGAIHSCVYEMRNRLAMGRSPQPCSASPIVSATALASSVQSHPHVGQKALRVPPESAPAASTMGQPAEAPPPSRLPPRAETNARGKRRRMVTPAHRGPRRRHPPWLPQIQKFM